MSLRAGLRKGTKSSAGGVAAVLRDSLGKTGRRLTSDPIRTSLGLLPSGPDPVGEWLVHRQSPGPYFGPKGSESKRAGAGFKVENTPGSSWPGLTRPSTSCFSTPSRQDLDVPVQAPACP